MNCNKSHEMYIEQLKNSFLLNRQKDYEQARFHLKNYLTEDEILELEKKIVIDWVKGGSQKK